MVAAKAKEKDAVLVKRKAAVKVPLAEVPKNATLVGSRYVLNYQEVER